LLRLNRLSPDAQTSDEAYYTSSSDRRIQNQNTNVLIHKESTSDRSSLSSTTPICTSSPILSLSMDDICNTIDHRVEISNKMETNPSSDVSQQNVDLLPTITNSNDRAMELFREIMINGDSGERDFKEMVEEFIQLIENKVSDTETKMFDTKYMI
jgi:hypothetical protein